MARPAPGCLGDRFVSRCVGPGYANGVPLLHPLMLERDAELDALASGFDRAAAGEGVLVLVEGATGVGKSDLLVVAEDMALERMSTALLARGTELERALPFGVVLQLLEPIVTSLPPDQRSALLEGPAGLAASLFPALRPLGGADSEDPFSLVHGAYWLIARLADRAPLAIMVDDAQWIDERSLQVLRYLAERIADLPVLLVIAGTPDAAGAGAPLEQLARGTEPIRLCPRPLSPAGTARLVLSDFPDADAAFCEAVFAATAGVPLLVAELLAAVRGQDLSPDARTGATLERLGPREVAHAVLARLEALPAGAPALARMAAVLGDDADLRHTARLAGVDPRQAAYVLDAMCSAGIAEPAEAVRFRHPLVRAALEASVPPAGRAHAHLQVAQALLVDAAPPERVAAHLVEAERGGRRWVVEVLRRAAARAVADGAPGSAVRYLLRALDEPPDPRARRDLLLELAAAEAAAGTPTASASITAALDEVQPPAERVQAVADLGRAPSAALDRSAIVEACEEGLRLARREQADREAVRRLEAQLLAESRDDLELRVRAHALLGSAGAADGDTPGGRELLAQRALEAALAGRPAEDVRDLAQHALGRGALLTEDRPGGHHISAAVRALTYAGDLQSAELVSAMALERARESGSPEAYARVCGLRADVALRRGSLSDAIADARAGRDAWPGGPDPRTTAILATALLEQGDVDAATRLLEDCGPELAEPPGAAALLDARAAVALVTGELEGAAADALAAGGRQRDLLADSPAVLDWRTKASQALAGTDIAQARRLATTQLDLAAAAREPRALGIALRAAGEVQGGEYGVALLRRSVSALTEARAPIEHARALVALGEALAARGDAREAGGLLRAALRLAERSGAALVEARARRALEAAGDGVAADAPSTGRALSPSERRVVDLATDGRSPAEIADALFMTVRTVEWQLRSACAKLGAASPDDLLDALRRTGPLAS